jgi:hypothetical protein
VVIGFLLLRQPLLLDITRFQVLKRHPLAQFVNGDNPGIFWQAKEASLLGIDQSMGGSDIGLERPHLRGVQGKPESALALAQRTLRLFQLSHIDDGADRAHGLWAIGCIPIEPPTKDRYPPNSPVGAHDPLHATPFSSVWRSTSCFDASLDRSTVRRIEQSRGLRIGHLRSNGQTQNGAERWREARSVVREVGLVNTNSVDLDCRPEQLAGHLFAPRASSRCVGIAGVDHLDQLEHSEA